MRVGDQQFRLQRQKTAGTWVCIVAAADPANEIFAFLLRSAAESGLNRSNPSRRRRHAKKINQSLAWGACKGLFVEIRGAVHGQSAKLNGR